MRMLVVKTLRVMMPPAHAIAKIRATSVTANPIMSFSKDNVQQDVTVLIRTAMDL